MNSSRLLRSLISYALIPLIILSCVSGIYLFKIVLTDKLSTINQIKFIYEEILIEKAADALATSDYPYFQSTIDSLIAKESTGIISIELINTLNNKQIVASSPISVPVDQPAKKIDIFGASFMDDRFNLANDIGSDKVGYLLIRYDETHVQQAVNHVMLQVLVLSIITLVLTLVIYYKIKQRVVNPYNQIKENLTALKNDDLMNLEIDHDHENEISFLIKEIKDNLVGKLAVIELMKNKIHRSKNETNEARFSQYEMIHELVNALEKRVDLSRKLILRLLENNVNEEFQQSYYLLSGTFDEITKSLSDSKNLIENPYADYAPESICIEKLYNNIKSIIVDSNYILYPTSNIKEELLLAYVLIDNLQIQLLVEKMLAMAAQVSVRSELYLNMLIEEISEDRIRISIEIKDSSSGMTNEEAVSINQYINNNRKEVDTLYYKHEDLKTIKHLKRIPELSININPDSGRGNYYRLSLECEYALDERELSINNEVALTHVIKVQEDPESDLLTEHYRVINIDINYVQFCKLENQLEYVINQDVIILDFTTNPNEALNICNLLSQYDCIIIAVVNDDQIVVSNDSYILDKLFDKGVKETLLLPYSPERLKETIKKVINTEENKISELVDSLRQKFNDF